MAGVMLRRIQNYGDGITRWQERHNLLLSHENSIRKDLAKIQESFIWIGIHLTEIQDLHLYDTVCYQSSGDYCKDVFEYAFQELDMSRTTVYNLLAVVRLFTIPSSGLLPEYRDYSFSQLVELLSFSPEDRGYADPRMSVRALRDLKKGKSIYVVDGLGNGRTVQLPVRESVCPDVGTTESKLFPTDDAFDKEFDDTMKALDKLIAGKGSELVKEQKLEQLEEQIAEQVEEVTTKRITFSSVNDFKCWYYRYCSKPFYPLTVEYLESSERQTADEK